MFAKIHKRLEQTLDKRKYTNGGTFQVVQWLRTRLPMQEMWIPSLVGNLAATTEPTCSGTCASQLKPEAAKLKKKKKIKKTCKWPISTWKHEKVLNDIGGQGNNVSHNQEIMSSYTGEWLNYRLILSSAGGDAEHLELSRITDGNAKW